MVSTQRLEPQEEARGGLQSMSDSQNRKIEPFSWETDTILVNGQSLIITFPTEAPENERQ